MRSSARFIVALQTLGLAAALPGNIKAETRAQDTDTYDYVVVGGGVTGLIVANRLTEDQKSGSDPRDYTIQKRLTLAETVLVIEAGRGDNNPEIRIPYGATYPLNTSLLWTDYVSEPEPELGHKTWNTRVARVLGGGSVVNGMMYDRGSRADYDAWEALGNKGWGWDGLFPFFKKGTTYVAPPQKLVDAFNITWDWDSYGSGPLTVAISDFQYPDINDYFAAFKGAGAQRVDGNNGEAYGAAWYPNTMNPRTGERTHARSAYYDPITTRRNFKVLMETMATEIVFDDSNKLRARGVKITDMTTGKTKTVYANKEVILAAGAVNTPKLLQLSGIGPKETLEAAGIKVKLEHDGVGNNFQDHPYTSLAFDISNMSTPNPTSMASDPVFSAAAWKQYNTDKQGPLTQARGNALAFIPLPEVAPNTYLDLADQIRSQGDPAFLPAIYQRSAKLRAGMSAQRKVLASLFQNRKAGIVEYSVPAAGSFMLVAVQRPLSRGSITLNPANPQGPPKILYNALTNPVDKSVMAACVRYIRSVWARPELSKFSPKETSPGAQYTKDGELIAKMTELGSIWPTLSHPSGSCAMMPEEQGGCKFSHYTPVLEMSDTNAI
jgi:choline dehydrogenase-like flavoprotein